MSAPPGSRIPLTGRTGGGPEQSAWAARPISERLKVMRRLRHLMVDSAGALANEIAVPGHNRREVILSEILPLAAAIRFLEREAAGLLKDRHSGIRGRPVWLGRVKAITRREPYGIIGIIGASNYPLLLAGVQTVQALAAGNAVLLKPGAGGSKAAEALQNLLTKAGLPDGMLKVLPDTVAAGAELTDGRCHKLMFTGSFTTGCKVLASLARHAIPAVVELSGCDAVFVREDADLSLVVRALVFGLDLNESCTCIAPRRILVARPLVVTLAAALKAAVVTRPASAREEALLRPICENAAANGAALLAGGPQSDGGFHVPCLLTGVRPDMAAAAADVFAPLLSLISTEDDEAALAANARCAYALGASVFSANVDAAQRLADKIPAGSVCINDLIAPTADPRTPFGGRGHSGFGVTRGAEGLLEMTTLKVIHRRLGRFLPHHDPPRDGDDDFFLDMLVAGHAPRFRARIAALVRMIRSPIARRPPSTPDRQS